MAYTGALTLSGAGTTAIVVSDTLGGATRATANMIDDLYEADLDHDVRGAAATLAKEVLALSEPGQRVADYLDVTVDVKFHEPTDVDTLNVRPLNYRRRRSDLGRPGRSL